MARLNLIVLILLFVMPNKALPQTHRSTILHSDSIYKLESYRYSYEIGDCDESKHIKTELTYFFIKDYYYLRLYFNTNGTVNSVLVTKDSCVLGTDFVFDSIGKIEYIKVHALGIEAGPVINFFPNGLIKSYFNFGFELSDLKLPRKERLVEALCGTLLVYETYYKERNGIEYHYSEDGDLIRMDYWKNDKIIRCDTIK